MMDVSICIVNWNSSDLLCDCLASIYSQNWESSFEIIVVDNASADSSVAMLRLHFPQVCLVANTRNMGFAAANNQAIAIARGRYIWLLNNDTVVLPGALDTMVCFMEEHPDAGVVGCKTYNGDGSLQLTCRAFPTLRMQFLRTLYLDRLLANVRWFGDFYYTYWNYDSIRIVDIVQGSSMFTRRPVLAEVGMLDEQFFMYSEEVDWCYRLKRHGWKTYFTSDAQIIHYGGQSGIKQSVDTRIAMQKSKLRYFVKYHGRLHAVLVRILFVVEAGGRLVFWSILRFLSHKDAQHRANLVQIYVQDLRWLLTSRTY